MANKSLPPSAKSRQRRIFIVAGLITTCVMTLALLELTHVTNFIHSASVSSQNGPTPEQQKQEEQDNSEHKKQAIENPTPPAPSPPPTTSNISMTTRRESNGTLTVLTNLGSLASGNCTLTTTNGAAINTQTAVVIYQPQYSTCAGFSVPIGSLGTGTWTLSLSVTSNGTTATKTQEVTVQ